MDFYCDNCRETLGEHSVLWEKGLVFCPDCGSVVSTVREEKKVRNRPYSLMDIHKHLETIKGKKESEMNLFELSIVSAMPVGIYGEIRNRVELALTYLEDGAGNTAASILRDFLKKGIGGE